MSRGEYAPPGNHLPQVLTPGYSPPGYSPLSTQPQKVPGARDLGNAIPTSPPQKGRGTKDTHLPVDRQTRVKTLPLCGR